MSGGGRTDPVAVLRAKLIALYDAARRPSYRQLEVHAARESLNLAPSTIGDLLNGTGTPRWGTVEAFVRACARHVKARKIALPDDRFDLDRWHADYVAMESAPADRVPRGSAAKVGRRRGPVVPSQLPADVVGFTGRDDQLAALDKLIADANGHSDAARTVVICTIVGTAGVGKTALAVNWAHRVREQFPDGQLYVNMRGFDSAEQVMDPADAVRGFLAALGVAARDLPADPDAQAALYRSRLVGRRMLVVLDNARDSAQVRPLLPGAPGCVVIVTSRSQLTGVIAVNDAQALPLDLMSTVEARELLSRRLGADRIGAEPRAVDDLIDFSARLPLALAIVAAHAIINRQSTLDVLASQLRDVRDRLDILAGDDPATDLRAVFSWSCHTLSDGSARLFRLLGLHPGPDISAAATASLAGLPDPRVRPLLRELADAHLVVEHLPGRYTCHDLLRAYAAEQAAEVVDQDERNAATRRLLDHYQHSARRADLLLTTPDREPITLADAQPGVSAETFGDRDAALDWLTAEHQVLLAVLEFAAVNGYDTHAWQLAWSLTVFLDSRGHWHDWVATQITALAAARRLGDLKPQARAHRILGVAYMRLGRYEDAHAQLQLAIDAYGEADDTAGLAHTYVNLGGLMSRQDRYAEVLTCAQQALGLYTAAGDQVGVADSLGGIGWAYAHLEDFEQALTYNQRSLAQFQQLQAPYREADVWTNLGYLYTRLHRYPEAIESYEQSIALFRSQSDRYFEAEILTSLGDTHCAAGDPGAAARAWRRALTILTELDHSDADKVRAKLRELSSTTPA